MIPFHKIYGWLFKSFVISGETELLSNLMTQWHTHIMVIKRSWVFWLFMIWIPLMILALAWASVWVGLAGIDFVPLEYGIIGGNILMGLILIFSTITYLAHFRKMGESSRIHEDLTNLRKEFELCDLYFTRFFNWTLTNQIILSLLIVTEIVLMFLYGKLLGENFLMLGIDIIIMIIEVAFLRHYRKRMMDLEMDYNIVVPGKIYFVNQSGILSSTQSIESEKIKTIRSGFPSRFASFFNYGSIDVLTEGDDPAMMGTMSMYYVNDPDTVVNNIQTLLKDIEHPRERKREEKRNREEVLSSQENAHRHSLDTREKIRDVLR